MRIKSKVSSDDGDKDECGDGSNGSGGGGGVVVMMVVEVVMVVEHETQRADPPSLQSGR